MSYNMWFLTPATDCSPAGEWIELAQGFGDESGEQQAELVAGKPKDWRQIHVTYTDGSWSFDFERYTVDKSGQWGEDLSFFRGWLGVVQPSVNTQWLFQFLARVQTVYMFRCSNSAPGNTLELVGEIVENMRGSTHGGLLYAELEGWSNEYGHLTWQFSDRVSGLWEMALCRDEGWETFQMDLGNLAHRTAFKAGKLPAGVESRFYHG